ncbi:MAG TPA: protein lplB, partial [Eubacterium sp.]|nr:protein lplB [Eubacterium sp.]
MDRENVKKNEKKNFMKEVKRQKFLLFWSAVFVIYGVIFYYIPLAGWAIGFQDYKPQMKTNLLKIVLQGKYVGWKHFDYLFKDERFLKAIKNTFAMGSLKLVFTTVFAIG